MEIIEFKDKFTELKKKFTIRHLTLAVMEEISQEFENLFKSFDLEDLQWVLKRNIKNGTVSLIPIRQIDKLAILGITSL